MNKINYTPCKNNETVLHKSGAVEYITFTALDKYPEVYNAFSTRRGGISTGMFSTMNLGRAEMDSPENVRRNFDIFCEATGISSQNILISDQQHTDNIKIASKEDRGKGIYRARDYEAIDGFITNESEVAICLLYADCVPVYLFDPVKKAVGLVHSGWKGTAAHISAKAIKMMHESYGTAATDIIAVIAPSICRNCYEVSGDLVISFAKKFCEAEMNRIFVSRKDELPSEMIRKLSCEELAGEKFQLDLWLANTIILENAGVRPDNIHVTDICTCCNSDLLFSHRASKGKRGNLAAILMLR